MSRIDKVRLYWDTIRCLKPVQIRYQIENRILKGRKAKVLDDVKGLVVPRTQKIYILIPELDCEEGYLQRFDIEGLLEGNVRLLHEKYHVEGVWNVPEASHLWNYNLHYLEFLIPLAAKYKETMDEKYYDNWKEWVKSWLVQSARDSFEPYTISMRIPNMLISMELLGDRIQATELYRTICESVYRQYRYLLHMQELALMANHYFENLKTIVISSLFFQELDIYHKYLNPLFSQIDEQILEDGFHFELSPMYHRIILEDILRIHTVMKSAGHTGDAEKLVPTIRLMASAMDCIEEGFERIPLFNDAGNNVTKDYETLLKAVERICGCEKRDTNNLEAAGYYKLYLDETTLLFDCGQEGPSYMGGHAHCDCLSFELSVDGKILFTNSGTGQYQGLLRNYFRSTAAHNTVMIDEREQSQLWGEHRIGRRISRLKSVGNDTELIGQFMSCQGDWFRRRLCWEENNRLVIRDDFRAHDRVRHIARQFLHLMPGLEYQRWEGRIYVKNGEDVAAIIYLPTECDYLIHTEGMITCYAGDFGEYLHKQVLEIRTQFVDRIQVTIEIEVLKRKQRIISHG